MKRIVILGIIIGVGCTLLINYRKNRIDHVPDVESGAEEEVLVSAAEGSSGSVPVKEEDVVSGKLDVNEIIDVDAEDQSDWLSNWKKRVEQLKDYLSSNQQYYIPEIELLELADWLDVVRDVELNGEIDYRLALADLRLAGKRKSMPVISNMIKEYIQNNDGKLPEEAVGLLQNSNSIISSGTLSRYEIGWSLEDLPARVRGETIMLVERVHVDDVWDSKAYFSAEGGRGWLSVNKQQPVNVERAIEEYQVLNGEEPASSDDILHLLEREVDHVDVEKIFDLVKKIIVKNVIL